MNHSKKVVCTIASLIVIASLNSCYVRWPAPVTTTAISQSKESDFIASISQVWLDTVNPSRRVTLANINSSNQVIGTDERYGGVGTVNLQGILNNFTINYTVIIKNQPPNYPKRYIAYTGTITDTTSTYKRMVVYSPIDTLYLKPK